MPLPNFHSARVKDPKDFQPDSFRVIKIKGTKGIQSVIGRPKGKTTTTTQSYRFPKANYTPAEAKAWLKRNNIKWILFEPAKGTESVGDYPIGEVDNPEEMNMDDLDKGTAPKPLEENTDEQLIEDVFFAPCTLEESEDVKYLRGVFAEADKKNRNERIYPRKVLNATIRILKRKTIAGCDGHPSMFTGGKPSDIALKFVDAWMEGDKAMIRAKILETTAGQDIQIIAKEKIPIGLSMRGYGAQEFNKKRNAFVISENYRLEGIDAVLTPAFEKALAVREELEAKKDQEEVDNMDPKIQEEITKLTESIATLNKTVGDLSKAKDDESKENKEILAKVKADLDAKELELEAKTKVAEILENDENFKDFAQFKPVAEQQLKDCKTPTEVAVVWPKVKAVLLDMVGKLPEPEPTSVIIKENGIFGATPPTSPEAAYNKLLDQFDDTGYWKGRSKLNNPRWCAAQMLENFLKMHMGGSVDGGAEIERAELFKRGRRNPLWHLTQEAIGDAETYTGDVAQTVAALIPIYVFTMVDLMNIVNQAVAVFPLTKPEGKAFFRKAYYGDGAGTWTEVNATNFARNKADKAEGAAPQLMKLKWESETVSLATAKKLMAEWTVEAQQDLLAYYGANIDSVHVAELRNEIMRELSHDILYELLAGTSYTKSDNSVQVTGSPSTYPVEEPTGWTKGDWLRYGLTQTVKKADALIKKSVYGYAGADVIIVDAAYDYLFTEPQFVSEGAILTDFGFSRIGTYRSHYKVFTTTQSDYDKKIVLCRRGGSFVEAAMTFLPYILFWIGGLIEQNTAEFSRTVMSRVAYKKAYGQKVSIINIDDAS